MIKKVDINCFGSFHDFRWDNALRDKGNNIVYFKKLNILYGRNYSGKTTLSRILQSLETGKLPEKYDAPPSFSVTTDLGTITHTQIPATDHEIRVYNRVFVEDHLSFLRDSAGKITPFAIIGSENKAINQEIDKIEKKLGNIEQKTGARYFCHIKQDAFSKQQSLTSAAENDLNQKLIDKANKHPAGIKHNPLYGDVNYDIRKIRADIEAIRKNSIGVLSEEEKKQKEALLRESPLPDIKKQLEFTPSISVLYEIASQLLAKKITPTKPIQELLDDAVLQTWVKSGIPHHRDKRNRCGFCGQMLPTDLWKKLDDHFSKESTDLEASIQENIEMITKERNRVATIVTVDSRDFYSTFQMLFEELRQALEGEIAKYRDSLDSLTKSLRNRIENIFTPIYVSLLTDNSLEIAAKIAAINSLIEKNNKKSESLESDQNSDRTKLRLNEIAQFIQDIELESEENKVTELKNKSNTIKLEIKNELAKIKEMESEVEKLRMKLKDEKKGAEKVNEYLNHYFGHDSLRLEAIEDTEPSTFKFQILRENKLAYNLSEGECSLVSFCYFMAKLKDTKSRDKKLIIYIDDPVSSLDSNHIFFVFSLIESLITRPEEDSFGNKILDTNKKPIFHYEQLFISTHNLEFLKFLKKLSKPDNDVAYFILNRKNSISTLELMPAHLKNFITELNYLFGEIYTCSEEANATTHFHCFYGFGNNLRKFLEAFLFFKYPCVCNERDDLGGRIKHFFQDESSTDPLVRRLINEFSHLAEFFDRSVQPIEHAEIAKLAKFVLKRIKENDPTQFECFLKSIDKPDPFIAPLPVSLPAISSPV